MTPRARWLALVAIAGLAFGMIRGQLTIGILSLSVLLWILWEGFCFWVYSERELKSMKVDRFVQGRSDDSGILWAGRTIDICVRIRNMQGNFRPTRSFRDIVPENLQLLPLSDTGNSGSSSELRHRDASPAVSSTVPYGQRWKNFFLSGFTAPHDATTCNQVTIHTVVDTVSIPYLAKVLSAGEVRFPGVRILFQDRCHLFRLDRVVAVRQSFRVLPSYSQAAETSSLVKRVNTLPHQGIHRQARSGLGFELLELREYAAGDPPKSIAWKASARRDKLMTRQYESEVPVRVQLFFDGAPSVRVGGFGLRMVDQMTHVAASIAHAAVSVGDAVGSYWVDGEEIHRVPAGSGNRALYKQLQTMAEHCIHRQPPMASFSKSLLEAAYAVCNERHPELLDVQVNPLSLSSWRLVFYQPPQPRIQMAGALAVLYDLSPTQHVQMLLDDPLIASYLQRFLCDSGMPWMAPVISDLPFETTSNHSRHAGIGKAVAKAVSHARDNEVFVLFVDLLGNPSPFIELENAVKFARAKHHRVTVICPSPTFVRPMRASLAESESIQEMRFAAEQIRLKELVSHLKRVFARLHVPLSISGESNAIPFVLSEIAIARTGRAAMQGITR